MTTYAYASAKLGSKLKTKTRSISKEVFDAAQKAGHDIWYMWGMGPSAEHSTGRALDLMIRNAAAGEWVRNYLWNNRKRLGLQHVIWNQRITSTVTQPGKVRKMADRGSPTKNHKDHVHVLFFDGKYEPPVVSKPVTPPAQLNADGVLGPKTIALWQKIMGTPVDGVISHPKSALVLRVQAKLKDRVDHTVPLSGNGINQDGKTHNVTIGALQRYLGVPVDNVLATPSSRTIVALQRRLNTGKF